MQILYLGPVSGTCLDRAKALRRLGHAVEHMDLRLLLPKTPWVDRVTWRLGGNWMAPLLLRGLAARLSGRRFDLCYVDGGEWVTPRVISLLRQHTPKVINYNIDDPLGPRDGPRFKALRQSLPHYDLNAVVRGENVTEARALGARNVIRVYRSADEVNHAPRKLTAHDHHRWDTDVLFLGTWFPERGPFLLELIRLGVPLAIQGPNWHKAPEWPHLKSHWKGGAIDGDDYAKAIQCAKVNLGLLSKENRDLHTTRSLEIPALGSLLCAERTTEHRSMYEEGQEALFWKDASECAAVCRYALDDDNRRRRIAQAGQRRVRRNGHYNEVILSTLLATAGIST
jgi:spore maturation protein CgeB